MINSLEMSRFALVIVAMLAGLTAPASPAFAYIDPNVGGQIWQAIYPFVAAVVGLLAFGRSWLVARWHALVGKFRSPPRDGKDG